MTPVLAASFLALLLSAVAVLVALNRRDRRYHEREQWRDGHR